MFRNVVGRQCRNTLPQYMTSNNKNAMVVKFARMDIGRHVYNRAKTLPQTMYKQCEKAHEFRKTPVCAIFFHVYPVCAEKPAAKVLAGGIFQTKVWFLTRKKKAFQFSIHFFKICVQHADVHCTRCGCAQTKWVADT